MRLLLGWCIRWARIREWLARFGVRISARLERIELDHGESVNGQNPWRLTAQWLNPATNKVYVFQSDALWFDPRLYVRSNEVDVVINPANPKQYVVDTSFLPQLG